MNCRACHPYKNLPELVFVKLVYEEQFSSIHYQPLNDWKVTDDNVLCCFLGTFLLLCVGYIRSNSSNNILISW